MKKSQWATPAGVDHDYNYLKRVERTLDDGTKNVQERGIGVDPAKPTAVSRAWEPGSQLQQYLQQHRITVHHAPLGMSRQKANRTRATKSGTIFWTMEWIDADGNRYLQDDCPAAKSVAELHGLHQAQQRNAAKRRHEGASSANKSSDRKRRKVDASNEHVADSSLRSPEAVPLGTTSLQNVGSPRRSDVHDHQDPLGDAAAQDTDKPHDTHDDDDRDPTAGTSADATLAVEATHQTETHYYLLKPGTTSNSKVLVVLDAQLSLTDSLRDRIVQEYPTIYALPYPPAALPSSYILESDYTPRASDESGVTGSHHNAQNDRQGNAASKSGEGSQNAQQPLDANSILKMLKRDLRS